MPALKTYDLFVSHAWEYGEHYINLMQLLNSANNFYYRNYSAPENKPLIPYKTIVPNDVITQAIARKISPVNCVIILSGMYVNHSGWIQTEINLARAYNKPIIGVYPRGNSNAPLQVSSVAKEMVHWNTNSIVAAIRKHSI